jgi:hypothetical protein
MSILKQSLSRDLQVSMLDLDMATKTTMQHPRAAPTARKTLALHSRQASKRCTLHRLSSSAVASSLLPPPSCFVTEFQYCSTWVYNWKITKKSLGPPSPKKERDSQKFESFEFTECERQILGCAMGMVHSLRGFRSRFQIYFAIQNSNKFSEIRCQILLTCPSG